MFRADLVAVDFFSAELAIDRVEAETVLSGDEGEGLGGVRAELVRRAGLARVVAGGEDAAGQRAPGVLEASDVIALPAVKGDRDPGEAAEGLAGVHPDSGVSFLGVLVGLLELGIAAGRNPGGFGSTLRHPVKHTKNGIRNESWK